MYTDPMSSSIERGDPQTQYLEQIAADVGAELCTLYSAALDDTVRTYVELLRFDAEELARCLGASGG